jgi:hypothetical protein
MRFSIGDVFATDGTVASQGVLVGEPPLDVAPTNIVQEGDAITLTTQIKTAANGPWLQVALDGGLCRVNHHITNVDDNTVVGTFPGGTLAPIAPPAGDSGPQPGEAVYQWYEATSGPINLNRDTYRILTHVHADAPYGQHLGAFQDGTMVHVLPG